MQLQQQLSQQQQELLQQLQLLHHQYLMHHGINLQQQFLSHKQKSHQLNGGTLNFSLNVNNQKRIYLIVRGIFVVDRSLSSGQCFKPNQIGRTRWPRQQLH